MAFRDFANGVKNFFGPNNKFFNGAREDALPDDDFYPQQSAQPAPSYPQDAAYGQPQAYNVPQGGYQAQAGYQTQAGYQQPYAGQSAGYTPQGGYQQPQQQPYAAQPQGYQTQAGYQQPQQAYAPDYQQQTVNQAYVPPRNRRAAQHAQHVENVVQFPGQPAAVPPQQAPAAAQQQAAPQQPAAQKQQPAACVINVRSIADCRSAIGILRTGDCVIAVMDSIADQAEVRRYVDTLNGACFSLGCTMTRTSARVGVYFLAPVGMQVLTDQATTQMNSQSRAPQRARAVQSPFQAPYQAQQPAYAPRSQQPGVFTAPQGGYQQPQQAGYAQQPFTPQQQPAYPQQVFSSQQPAQGYTPDREPAEYSDAVM